MSTNASSVGKLKPDQREKLSDLLDTLKQAVNRGPNLQGLNKDPNLPGLPELKTALGNSYSTVDFTA